MGSQHSTNVPPSASASAGAGKQNRKLKPQDHYEILGIDSEATSDDIKKASVLSILHLFFILIPSRRNTLETKGLMRIRW